MSREATLEALSSFLRRNGWAERAGKRRLTFAVGERTEEGEEVAFRIFEHPRNGAVFKVVFPIREDGVIPRRYMEDGLNAIAAFYEISQPELLARIEAANVDILWGVYPHSALSLARAHQIVTNLKNLFAHAANAEMDPQPFLADSRGSKITEDVNFGHTLAGSFGFRVECPLRSDDRQLVLGGELPVPLERRLLERLAYGFVTVEVAAASGDISVVCDSFRVGFNANICDAVASLCDPEETDSFTFKFQWASLFPLRDVLKSAPSVFMMTPRKYAIVREASGILKTMASKPKATLVGTIVGLSSDVPPLQLGLMAHRKVILLVASGDYEGLKMQLEVSDADYRIAFSAHGEGRLLAVTGVPTQRGTHWRIEDHQGLVPV